MMGALADIYVDTGRILVALGYEEDGDAAPGAWHVAAIGRLGWISTRFRHVHALNLARELGRESAVERAFSRNRASLVERVCYG